VNYRALAGDAVSKVLELVESIEANQGATKASLVHSWLMQRLMHEGPSPEKDSQMFQVCALHLLLHDSEVKDVIECYREQGKRV
jgi:hypothetical protein